MNFREIFYISNLLSLSRVVLILPIYYFLKMDTMTGSYWAVFLMLIVALTDTLDGRLARKLNQQSDFGRVVDPVADKIAIAVIALMLINLRDLPIWFLVLVLTRDVAILLLGLFVISKQKIVIESQRIGKVTAFMLGTLMIIFTLDLPILKEIFLWTNVALILTSSIVYFGKFKSTVGAAKQS